MCFEKKVIYTVEDAKNDSERIYNKVNNMTKIKLWSDLSKIDI